MWVNTPFGALIELTVKVRGIELVVDSQKCKDPAKRRPTIRKQISLIDHQNLLLGKVAKIAIELQSITASTYAW